MLILYLDLQPEKQIFPQFSKALHIFVISRDTQSRIILTHFMRLCVVFENINKMKLCLKVYLNLYIQIHRNENACLKSWKQNSPKNYRNFLTLILKHLSINFTVDLFYLRTILYHHIFKKGLKWEIEFKFRAISD